MNRIEAIFSYIDNSDLVVDVGCDQAKLGIMLAKRNQKSIACDISENVINKAICDIKKLKLEDLIDLRISDGLSNIKENEADTLILAGMGTYTILDILNNSSLKFKKIITVSNRNNDTLRFELNKLNYKVSCEQIIYDKDKYYNLIVFIPGNKEYTKSELLLGCNHQDKELFEEWKQYLLDKYLLIKESSIDKNDNIDETIKIIKESLL